MAKQTIINKFGRIAGWSDITVNVLGRDLEGITSVKYDDEQDWNNEYGAGDKPIGESKGNYSATGSLTLYAEELNALQQQLPRGNRIQDIASFDVVIQYEYASQLFTDILRNCRFRTNGRESNQGDGKIEKEVELKISHIDWNV